MTTDRSRVEFVADRAATLDALAELDASVRNAQYELGAAVAVARTVGITWTEIATALGYSGKQTAQQAFTRKGNSGRGFSVDVLSMEPDERERVGRLIGVGRRAMRYEVRTVLRGRRGVSRVETVVVSRHLDRHVALEAGERHAHRGHRVEVHAVRPDAEQVNRERHGDPNRVDGEHRRIIATFSPDE